ncbi:MAG: GAF domain-containing protein [Firmicutes bacterium]|nr:GAF domain-containing protein [Bacillota bacterium]
MEIEFRKRALCEMCEAVNSALELREALEVITKNAVDKLGLKASSIRLLDPKREILEIAAACGLSDAYLKKGPVKVSNSQIDREALGGKLVFVYDVTSDRRVQYPEEMKREGLSSLLCIPISFKGQPIGVLRAYTGELHEFTPDEIDVLCILAAQGGVAIRNARLHHRTRTLSEIAGRINSTLELAEVLDLLVENAAKALDVKAASLRLLDRSGKRLVVSSAYGLSEEYLQKGPVDVERSILDGEVLSGGRPVKLLEAAEDPRFQYRQEAEREGIRSVLCVPLFVKEKPVGVLRVYTEMPYDFAEDEVDFLTALGNLGAIAIENARMYKELKDNYDRLMTDIAALHEWGGGRHGVHGTQGTPQGTQGDLRG